MYGMLKNCRRSLRGGEGLRDNAGPIDYPVLHIYACTSRLRLLLLCASPSRHTSQVHIRSNRGRPTLSTGSHSSSHILHQPAVSLLS